MSAAPIPVLLVYPFCLDHVGHGNIQRVIGIARFLAGVGFAVDLAYQGSHTAAPVPAQYAGLRRVFAIEPGFRSSSEDASSWRLRSLYEGHQLPGPHQRPSPSLTAFVRGLLEAEWYAAVISTYAWTAPIFTDLSRPVLTICDTQDILHQHATACRNATGHGTLFSLPAATEAHLWRQWDVLLGITPEDCDAMRPHAGPRQRVLCARHATPIHTGVSVGADDVALLAASDNASNVASTRWLLDDVWPRVIALRPTARLQIAGLICRALPASAAQPGVDVIGFRKDLSDDTSRCGVVVAPYLYGSGLKIKVVEAACFGKAAITTAAGVAGSGLEPNRAIAVEDDAAAFATALATLLGDSAAREKVASRALEQANRLFSPRACYGELAGVIRESAARRPAPTVAGVAVGVLDRIAAVAADVAFDRIVLWGNGSHTRSLLAALESIGLAADLVVDGRHRGAYDWRATDLIVLSSESFEPEMWQDLGGLRAAGGLVLGLYENNHVSDALLPLLSVKARVVLGITHHSVTRQGQDLHQPFMETSYAIAE